MAAGQYKTVCRAKILEYLEDNCDKTVNVHDINCYLIEHECSVNLTTIYRYLDKLTQEGRVMKYSAESGSQAVYQYVKPSFHCDEHLHLQCVKCGAICHLDSCIMEKITDYINSEHGFRINCKNSIIYGVCNSCEEL